MIASESVVASACLGERSHSEFHVFDEGFSSRPPFCPRTVEILTVLNDVFDALVPGDGGLIAEPA